MLTGSTQPSLDKPSGESRPCTTQDTSSDKLTEAKMRIAGTNDNSLELEATIM
jgi:hypothetical protein